MRQRDLKSLENLLIKSISKLDQLETKYSIKLEKQLNKVGKEVIDDWYASYVPNEYIRKGSLYKAFRVKVKNGSYSVDFGSGFGMYRYKHRVTVDYIYENSFMQGWHGGANDGPNHPFPGYPYYREPYPFYSNWYYLAEKSFSPYKVMDKRMDKVIQDISDSYTLEFKDKIVDKINKRLNTILKGG